MIELKGKPVADFIYSEIQNQMLAWAIKKWELPHLAVVLVGADPASQVYVSHKQKACEKLKFKSTLIQLPAHATESDVTLTLERLNQDPTVDAVLLQLPLQAALNSKKMTEVISADKDADGLTQASLGALMAGEQRVASCTPAGIMELIRFYKISLIGKKVVILGRSLIVGLPLMHLLIQANATVTICHSKTENLKQILIAADVAFIAIGRPQFFQHTDFKKGAIVIDVGIHRLEKGLCGDVAYAEQDHLAAITPVPGGVGPMTIAMLMKNAMTLAEQHRIVKS